MCFELLLKYVLSKYVTILTCFELLLSSYHVGAFWRILEVFRQYNCTLQQRKHVII